MGTTQLGGRWGCAHVSHDFRVAVPANPTGTGTVVSIARRDGKTVNRDYRSCEAYAKYTAASYLNLHLYVVRK